MLRQRVAPHLLENGTDIKRIPLLLNHNSTKKNGNIHPCSRKIIHENKGFTILGV